jgi:hypothetical protein
VGSTRGKLAAAIAATAVVMVAIICSIAFIENHEDSDPTDDFDVKLHDDDRLRVLVENASTSSSKSSSNIVVFDISCPSGIGSATIERKAKKWPKALRVRLRLKGLERFRLAVGDFDLSGSVSSLSGHEQGLYLTQNDSEGSLVEESSPYWTKFTVRTAKGKSVNGLPGEGGYFEFDLPRSLFAGNPESMTLHWIDFYRT